MHAPALTSHPRTNTPEAPSTRGPAGVRSHPTRQAPAALPLLATLREAETLLFALAAEAAQKTNGLGPDVARRIAALRKVSVRAHLHRRDSLERALRETQAITERLRFGPGPTEVSRRGGPSRETSPLEGDDDASATDGGARPGGTPPGGAQARGPAQAGGGRTAAHGRRPRDGVRASDQAPSARGGALPMSHAELPSHDLLERLERGEIAWREVLTAPTPVPRAATLERVLARPDAAARHDLRTNLLTRYGVMSARQAMQEALGGRAPTVPEARWAQRQFAAHAKGQGELDRRHGRVTPRTAMVPLTMALTLLFYMGRRKASAAQIAQAVNERLDEMEPAARAAGYAGPIPRVSRSTVGRFTRALPEVYRTVRRDGGRTWKQQARIVDRWDEAEHANHIWELDHTPLDIAIVASSDEPDRVVRAFCTACVDAFSGLPLALHVSTVPPDAFTSSIVLERAIRAHQVDGVRIGGLPTILRPDHGADFMSAHVGQVAASLSVRLEPAAEGHPDGKPHVERFFRTLNESLAILPGYTKAEGTSQGATRRQRDRLLTAEQLIARVERFRVQYAKTPSEKRSGTPLERFAEGVRWRWPARMDDLDLLLLRADESRTLTREGVKFRNAFYKGHPETPGGHALQELVGRRVVIRYHPDVADSIVVYDEASGDRLGEFVREELWKERHGGAAAANTEFLPTLKALTRGYADALHREDRAAAKQARKEESAARVARARARDAAAGVRTPSRAEAATLRAEARPSARRRELMQDLL